MSSNANPIPDLQMYQQQAVREVGPGPVPKVEAERESTRGCSMTQQQGLGYFFLLRQKIGALSNHEQLSKYEEVVIDSEEGWNDRKLNLMKNQTEDPQR